MTVKTETPKEAAFDRFITSQPIASLLKRLAESGLENFKDGGVWEVCLCALIIKLKPKCRLQDVLESLPYRLRRLQEEDVLNTMAQLGYAAYPAECDLHGIDPRLLPGLFVPHNGDPCIVIGYDAGGVLHFYDPLSNAVSAVPPGFAREGKVWFFKAYSEHTSPSSKFMRKGTGHSWFRALLGRFKGTLVQVMLAGLVLNLIALVTPLFIMLVYDRVIAVGAAEILPMLTLGAFLAIVFEFQLRAIRSRGLSWLAGRLDNIVSNQIFSHLLGLPPALIERASVSAQIARIKTFESVRDFFAGSVFLSLLEAPFVVLAVAAVAAIAGKLVLVPLAMVAGYGVLFYAVRNKVKVAIRLAAKSSSARQQFTIEAFEKLGGIQGHGLTEKWQQKFRHLSGREMMMHFNLAFLGMVAETFAHSLTVVAAVATVGFGVERVWSGTMSTGALVAAMILVWRILTPFYSMCTMIPRLEQLRNSIIQVNNLMDIETEDQEAKQRARLPAVSGRITFQDVSFRYSEEADPVFRHLSFEAQAGDLIAITGGNGTGKGSILKLIQGLYTAQSGAILIDGFDIRQLDLRDLRRQIGYVPKTPTFFCGTLAENLRAANPSASDVEVQSALVLADAWEEVCRYPQGMHTVIGKRSPLKLTPDFAMRLSLARAYLHPGKILAVDELPNALLTGEAKRCFKDYLALMKRQKTILMVTYREDYMALADQVVWLRGTADVPIAGEARGVLQQLYPEAVA